MSSKKTYGVYINSRKHILKHYGSKPQMLLPGPKTRKHNLQIKPYNFSLLVLFKNLKQLKIKNGKLPTEGPEKDLYDFWDTTET